MGAVGGAARVAHGCGDGLLFTVGGVVNDLADVVECGKGDDFGCLLVSSGQDEGEFFATVAGSKAFFTDAFVEGFCDLLQYVVSGIVSVGFVEEAEVINVDHDDADSGAVAADFFTLFSEKILEGAVVAEAGEGVGCGEGLDVFEELGGVNDEGELFGDGVVQVAFHEEFFSFPRGEHFEVADFVLVDLEGEKGAEAGVPDFPGGDIGEIFGRLVKGDVGSAGFFLSGGGGGEFAVFADPNADGEEIEGTADAVGGVKG